MCSDYLHPSLKQMSSHFFHTPLFICLHTISVQFSSVAQLCPTLCDPIDCRLPCPSPATGACSNSCPSSWNAIQHSHPLSSLSPPAFNLPRHQGLFQWVSSSHQVAKVLALQLQHQSFQWIFRTDILDWLVWSPCSPRDSQDSSPIPQFKSISSLVLSLLYGPTLTSVHDYWKNQSFDYMDFCWPSDVSAFLYAI